MAMISHSDRNVFWARILLVLVMVGSALGLYALGALPLIWAGVVFSALLYIGSSWALLATTGRRPADWIDYGQIMADVAWVAVFVRLTGGTENNPFTLLFFLAIIAASYVRFVRGAILAATLASLAYAGLLWLDLLSLKHSYRLPVNAELPSAFSTDFYLNGYVYAICFYLVAAFSGFLAERVRLKGRQLELATRELEDFRLSTGDILEKMGSGLLTLNGAGQIKYCNAAGSQILGLGSGVIVGQSVDGAFRDGLDPFREALAYEFAAINHQAVRNEITITRSDGADVPIGLSTTQIKDGAGAIKGLIAIFQDLTQVKQNESRLFEIEQLASMRELTAALLSQIKPEVGKIEEALVPILNGAVDSRAAQSLAIVIKQRSDTIIKTVDDYIRFARIELTDERAVPSAGAGSDGIIGSSAPFSKVMAMVRQIAPTDSTVLIFGESGTGKELLARELHRLSQRSKGPFVCINCAALPETLLESELFGHVRGSFTGAVRDKEGLFRVASGGTVFLDEVSETSPAIQVKLLRVLQEREIVPVGGTRPIKVDVRLISATNADLSRAVEQGKFRMDLFYRINVIPVNIPPLRERQDDIAPLAEHFLDKMARKEGNQHKRLSAPALDALTRYHWPGNVRQLENVIERAAVLAVGPLIERSHLPQEVLRQGPAVPGFEAAAPASETVTLKERERQAIVTALKQAGGNKAKAARDLGIHYATLYRKMKQYGIT